MKIKYEFVTGEKLEIEVEDNIGEIVVEMEVLQSRRNRAETRRHNSLESMQESRPGYNLRQFIDEKADIEQHIVDSEERERLHQAIGKLEEKDALIVHKYFFENLTMSEIGCELGVSTMAISKRLKKIPEKIKKYMT